MGRTFISRVAINCNSSKFIQWVTETVSLHTEYLLLNGDDYILKVAYTPDNEHDAKHLSFWGIYAEKESCARDLVTEEELTMYGDRFPLDISLGYLEIIDTDQESFELTLHISYDLLNTIMENTLKDANKLWDVTVLNEIEASKLIPINIDSDVYETNIETNSPSIPKNIYSKDLLKYKWLTDVDKAKTIYRDYSIQTVGKIIRTIKKAHDNKRDGQWGPKKIADILDMNPTVVGRYLKVLKVWGVETIDDINIPHR